MSRLWQIHTQKMEGWVPEAERIGGKGEWLLKSVGFLLRMIKFSKIVMIVAQLYEYTKQHCELWFNKTSDKRQDKIVHSSPLSWGKVQPCIIFSQHLCPSSSYCWESSSPEYQQAHSFISCRCHLCSEVLFNHPISYCNTYAPYLVLCLIHDSHCLLTGHIIYSFCLLSIFQLAVSQREHNRSGSPWVQEKMRCTILDNFKIINLSKVGWVFIIPWTYKFWTVSVIK